MVVYFSLISLTSLSVLCIPSFRNLYLNCYKFLVGLKSSLIRLVVKATRANINRMPAQNRRVALKSRFPTKACTAWIVMETRSTPLTAPLNNWTTPSRRLCAISLRVVIVVKTGGLLAVGLITTPPPSLSPSYRCKVKPIPARNITVKGNLSKEGCRGSKE